MKNIGTLVYVVPPIFTAARYELAPFLLYCCKNADIPFFIFEDHICNNNIFMWMGKKEQQHSLGVMVEYSPSVMFFDDESTTEFCFFASSKNMEFESFVPKTGAQFQKS